MKNTYQKLGCMLVVTLGLSGAANAALIDRGNGMIYDSSQDITWMQDANYAMTSGYDADGAMTWFWANIWADNLVYGGYDDWRLFDADPGCGGDFNCTDNELGNLFYNSLNLSAGDSVLDSPESELGLFINIVPYSYWSGNEYAVDNEFARSFDLGDGAQSIRNKGRPGFAWAVRDGDVITVPEPATGVLLGAGMLGVMLSTRRRKRDGLLQDHI
jgi:hypothetical protein